LERRSRGCLIGRFLCGLGFRVGADDRIDLGMSANLASMSTSSSITHKSCNWRLCARGYGAWRIRLGKLRRLGLLRSNFSNRGHLSWQITQLACSRVAMCNSKIPCEISAQWIVSIYTAIIEKADPYALHLTLVTTPACKLQDFLPRLRLAY